MLHPEVGAVIDLFYPCLQLSRARQTSHLRLSRHLAIEDLIFLIRDDRVKVNRLRTYLSWKEVRKNAKKEGDNVGAGLEIGEEEVGDGESRGFPLCQQGRNMLTSGPAS